MENFKEVLKERTGETEQIVYAYMPQETGYQKDVIEAMNYSLTAGGKRLRPMLVMETARLFGFEDEEVRPFITLSSAGSAHAIWDKHQRTFMHRNE